MKRKLSVLFPIILGLALICCNYRVPGLTVDGVTYLQIARNILMGKGLGWQASWAPPLHSILVAAASYLTHTSDLLVSAGIISSLMFFGLILAVYFLALELFDIRTALVASLFTALSPHFQFIAFSPEAEITYTFFLTLALFFFARTVTRGSITSAIALGVSFALAWMSRSEGFLVMAFVFMCVTAAQGLRFHQTQIFRFCLLAILFFMLTAAPYLLFLHKHYGGWVISPKSSYVMIWMKGKTYHDHAKEEMDDEELWGLTPDGRKLRWQEPKGITDLVDYLMEKPGRNLSIYLRNLGLEMPGRISNNSGMERYPQVFPIYLAFAALLSAFMSWGKFGREKKITLLAPLLILLVFPLFTAGWWKYMVPYLPLIIIMAAKGFTAGADIAAAKLSSRNAATLSICFLTAVTILISARFVFALHPLSLGKSASPAIPAADVTNRRELTEEAQKAGHWGAERFGPGRNYMANWSKIVYHLNGLWTVLPVADLRETLEYARQNEVDYIVLEAPTVAALKDPPPDGLRLAGLYQSSAYPYVAAFYRLELSHGR